MRDVLFKTTRIPFEQSAEFIQKTQPRGKYIKSFVEINRQINITERSGLTLRTRAKQVGKFDPPFVLQIFIDDAKM